MTDQWQNQGLEPTGPYQYPAPFEAPSEPKKNSNGVVIGLAIAVAVLFIAVLFIAVLGLAGYMLGSRSGGSAQDQSVAQSAPQTASEDSKNTARPAYPQLPEGAEPANDAAQRGEAAGNFNNVYRGTEVTSLPFAVEVREAYARHFLDTQEYNAVLEVKSPVTGDTYSMDCKDNGQFVTCTGGNNAVVYIS